MIKLYKPCLPAPPPHPHPPVYKVQGRVCVGECQCAFLSVLSPFRFVLKKDNCLYYYKHSEDKDSLGVIVLANYSISKAVEASKKHCFRLSKGGARTYYLCAADENDMRKWMMALNEALKRSAKAVRPFLFV